jgi:hypothetical protein
MVLIAKPIEGRQEKRYAFVCWKRENPNETSMEYHDDQDWHFLYNDKKEIVGSTCSNNLLGDKILQTVYVYNRHRGQGYMAKIIETMNPDMIELGKYDINSDEHNAHMEKYAEMGYNQHIVSMCGLKQVGEYVCRRGWRPNPMPEVFLNIIHIPMEVINDYKSRNKMQNIWVSDLRKSIDEYYNEIQSV